MLKAANFERGGRLSTSQWSAKGCLFVSFTTNLSKPARVLFNTGVSRVRGKGELVVRHDSG